MGGDGPEAADRDLATHLVRHGTHVLAEIARVVEQQARLVDDAGTGDGGRHPLGMVAHEHLDPAFSLELRDRRRDRGLRDVQVPGGLGQVSEVGGGYDIAQHPKG